MSDVSQAMEEAIALFNRRAFFECHEVLEDLWRPLPPGPEKQFLQGVLQVGVGFHHIERHNFVGGRNKLQAGLEKLEAVAAQSAYQPFFELAPLIQGSREALNTLLELGPERIADFPERQIPLIEHP